MKLHRTTRYNPELFNLIPLINVLFLVLAFATLGQNFIVQPGLSVVLPVSSFALSPERHPQIVSITGDALPTMYFRDKKVEIQELEALLSDPKIKDRSLIIRADRAVPYDLVSNVMNIGLRRGYSVAVASTTQPQ